MKALLVLALIALAAPLAHASEQSCGAASLNGGKRFSYCIYPGSPRNPDVLWYFHSVFSSEKGWLSIGDNQAIREAWAERGLAPPTVIAVSFGWFWLMTEENGLYPYFVREILPYLETQAGVRVNEGRGKRLLMGRSMGGFNASQLLFRDAKLFSRAALACPAMLAVGPASSPGDVKAFFGRHQPYLNGFKVNAFLGLLRQEFRRAGSWAAHDPIQLSARSFPRDVPLYVSCGDRDNYGFFEGAEAFARNASRQGGHITWDPIPGQGHCAMNGEKLAAHLYP